MFTYNNDNDSIQYVRYCNNFFFIIYLSLGPYRR